MIKLFLSTIALAAFEVLTEVACYFIWAPYSYAPVAQNADLLVMFGGHIGKPYPRHAAEDG
jgi:hypothetical protein